MPHENQHYLALGDEARGAADALLYTMEDISEECYCAGWMRNLEFDLWDAASPDDPGMTFVRGGYHVEPLQRDALALYSRICGGWWRWNDGPEFVTFDQWAQIVASRNAEETTT
jgi:hypothetical protein